MIPRRKNTNGDVTRRSSKLYTVYEVNLQFTPTISGFSCYPTTGIVGSRPFENRYRKVVNVLESKGLYTSRNEIQRAVNCLRFLDPDLTGAATHSRAAVECVARKVTRYPKKNLYQILKILEQHPDILPAHLVEEGLELWRDASEKGAHLREGDKLTHAEAEWVVVISIKLCLYLAHKIDNVDSS